MAKKFEKITRVSVTCAGGGGVRLENAQTSCLGPQKHFFPQKSNEITLKTNQKFEWGKCTNVTFGTPKTYFFPTKIKRNHLENESKIRMNSRWKCTNVTFGTPKTFFFRKNRTKSPWKRIKNLTEGNAQTTRLGSQKHFFSRKNRTKSPWKRIKRSPRRSCYNELIATWFGFLWGRPWFF